MRNLYLRIYVTVVAVLLVFALIVGWFAQRHLDHERASIQAVVAERVSAWATLIENSLPPGSAPAEEQRNALLEWSQRLRVPLALEDPNGERIAASPSFLRLEGEPYDAASRATRVWLADGRALWVWRPSALRMRRPETEGDPGQPVGPPPGGLLPQRPSIFGIVPPPPWFLAAGGGGLALTLAILYVAVAIGAYPVVRRLTRRLESLKRGVEAFGAGQLSHRVDAGGRDEVAAVAASFNRAAAQIEALVGSHRSLLANASHELRSPLARLKMAVSMLETASPAGRERLKDEIEHNIRELDALVEEVLLASRLDAQRDGEAQERVELLPLAAEEAAYHDATASGDEVAVLGNERLLRRALRNLLENADRYGGEVPPEVQIAGLPPAPEQAEKRVEVAVCDRGPGVPESERERIFEPFYRLPGHAEQAGGVGLGLSLVRQIAERHGGKVRVEPREGGGSRFVITLPVAG